MLISHRDADAASKLIQCDISRQSRGAAALWLQSILNVVYDGNALDAPSREHPSSQLSESWSFMVSSLARSARELSGTHKLDSPSVCLSFCLQSCLQLVSRDDAFDGT